MMKAAKPIFVKGKGEKKNCLAGFRHSFQSMGGRKVTARITAGSFYRLYLNGQFVSVGPARAQYGYLRVDEIDVTPFVQAGRNEVAIEVMGYNVQENYFLTYETSKLAAEFEEAGAIICASDRSWTGIELYQKKNDVEYLGFGRRVPLEVYALDREFFQWRTGTVTEPCEELPEPAYLPRGVENPDFSLATPPDFLGVYSRIENPAAPKRPAREWWEKTLPESARTVYTQSYAEQDRCFDGEVKRSYSGCERGMIILNGYERPAALDFAFREADTGHVGLVFSSDGPVTIDLVYNDNLDRNGHIPVYSDSIRHVIRLQAPGGRFAFESLEWEFVKYVKVIIRGGGRFQLEQLYLRRDRFPDLHGGSFQCSDARLNQIYAGAKQTLLTNTLDFFMDCPSRERGGWSGDSYWTGRAMRMLNGDNMVEKTMLENFLLSNSFEGLDGTFASCCCGGPEQPADLLFNWNLFLLYELADYCRRTDDRAFAQRYERRATAFLDTASRYRNESGFLENPPGTIFIDWSGANDKESVSPISLPTNMLYASVLKEMAELYGVEKWRKQSETIMAQAERLVRKNRDERYGLFCKWPYFPDSLTFEAGELRFNGGWSEAAQYYLFWLGYLTRENAPELLEQLTKAFGPCPERYRGTPHLAVKPAGFFFGYMVRFEMLSKTGQYEVLLREIKELYGYMLDHGPGTYWETLSGGDSLNHGFGSHVGVSLMRDFLGLSIPDEHRRLIEVAPHPSGLNWAKGSARVEDSVVSVQWESSGERFVLSVSAPPEYTLAVALPNELMYHSQMTVNGEKKPLRREIVSKGSMYIMVHD